MSDSACVFLCLIIEQIFEKILDKTNKCSYNIKEK